MQDELQVQQAGPDERRFVLVPAMSRGAPTLSSKLNKRLSNYVVFYHVHLGFFALGFDVTVERTYDAGGYTALGAPVSGRLTTVTPDLLYLGREPWKSSLPEAQREKIDTMIQDVREEDKSESGIADFHDESTRRGLPPADCAEDTIADFEMGRWLHEAGIEDDVEFQPVKVTRARDGYRLWLPSAE